MYVEDDQLEKFVSDTLEEMRNTSMPVISEQCPHCGYPIRYPVMAKKSDLERFNRLLHTAAEVMRKHGITANLLADIRAQCLINIVKKNDN